MILLQHIFSQYNQHCILHLLKNLPDSLHRINLNGFLDKPSFSKHGSVLHAGAVELQELFALRACWPGRGTIASTRGFVEHLTLALAAIFHLFRAVTVADLFIPHVI